MRRLKGLVLAGGKGSRLRPLTATGAKQLVPVANKPVLYYALEQLVEAGISEIGIVTGDTGEQVRAAIGDGSRFGATISYLPQEAPLGLAHAIVTAEEWLGDDAFCMYLGDNFLMGGIAEHARRFAESDCHAQILLKQVQDPTAFGVAILDDGGRVTKLVEKPKQFVSDMAVIGVYFFGPEVHAVTPGLVPSARGELEITDVNRAYLAAGALTVEVMGRGYAWLDTGTHASMLEASQFIETIERRQGLKISCPEEIAYRMGFIDAAQLARLAEVLRKNDYGQYLFSVLQEKS